MLVDSCSIITLNRNGITVVSRSPEGDQVVEGRLLYSHHKDIRDAASDFVEEIAGKYALTAFGHVCTQCGNCCRRDNILVLGSDIFNIAHKLGISAETFRKRYIRPADTWNEYDGYLKMKRGKCPFLKKDINGYFSCSIYEIRPQNCRLYQPVGELCVKDRGYLAEYLKAVKISGDEISLTVASGLSSLDGEEPVDYDFKYRFQDEKLQEILERIISIVSSIGGEQVNLLEAAIMKAEKVFDNFLDNYHLETEKPGFSGRVEKLREILEDLAQLSIKSPGIYSPLDELWNKLQIIESRAAGEVLFEPAGMESRDESRLEEGYLQELGHIKIKSASFFPEVITFYLEQEGGIFPCPVHLSCSEKIRKAVRNFMKQAVLLDGEKLQASLTAPNPDCYLCGECCSYFGIEIKPSDIRRLATNLGMSAERFREEYLTPHHYSWNKSDGCMIKEYKEGENTRKCILLDKSDDGFYYCSVHPFKPRVCRDFSSRHLLCTQINNHKYWYRLLRNIIRADLTPSRLVFHTYRTHKAMGGGFQVNWKEAGSLVKALQSLFLAVEEELSIKK